MQRFFFAIAGDPMAIDVQGSVNILPRNEHDTRTNLSAKIEIHHIFHEFSNDLVLKHCEVMLCYLRCIKVTSLAIDPSKDGIARKMKFFASMSLIREKVVKKALEVIRHRRLMDSER